MHRNRISFQGCVGWTTRPSDRPPSGSKGHCVVLSHRATLLALDSLIGMPVNRSEDLLRHGPRIVGTITKAWLDGTKIMVDGYLWPMFLGEDLAEAIERKEIGFSWEAKDCRIENLSAPVWRIQDFHFVGVSILRKDHAAYQTSWVELNTDEAAIYVAAGADNDA